MNSDSLFQNSAVIKLEDTDFKITSNPVGDLTIKLIHPKFRNNDGYIMAYASWCGFCQAKEEFWSYLAKEFNTNPKFMKEHFRIAVIDSENPKARKIIQALQVTGIPRFFHVVNDPQNPQEGDIENYEGPQTLQGLIGAVCESSAQEHLCNFNPQSLTNVPAGY